ncbi:hypothetical protein N7532_011896 [Penicillium argentinense]|uniref:Mtf2-like C-terminal domain-containing protein n=1 Tax=Penicillium argentinense TaxID=1131581 RepID=A0A9W9EJD5_9EURO|nr:uncharacterized protein N7532_011896 [Penicillium argentinense]KAJ5082853.1 hypothetical protein N7532_011896 [Penicillium argentinense]
MATNISRALFLSATANSTTPFLYHTRTLCPILRSFQTPATPRLRHSYSTRTDEPKESDEPDSHRSQNVGDTEYLSYDALGEDPFIRPPVSSYPSRKSYLRSRGSSSKARHSSRTQEQFKSVTNREKQAFGRLLSQFEASRLTADENNGRVTQGTKQPQNSPHPEQDDIAKLMKVFEEIMDTGDREKAKSESRSTSASNSGGSPDDDSLPKKRNLPDMSNGIPLGERLFTREELGLPSPRSGKDLKLSMAQATAIVVQREQSLIESALFEAIEGNKGDIGVWEVCKTRIFSMLRYMDKQNSAIPSMPSDEDTSDSPLAENAVMIPPKIPAGLVITQLYPRAVLMAFRLLNTHFPDSHLAGQFRASIKAQGRTSAFLGASPQLYAEMVDFYWHGCRDLPAVLSFLQDMDMHGLVPPRDTIRLLRLIEREGKTYQKSGSDDAGIKAFWDLSPNKKALHELVKKGGWFDHWRALKPVRRKSSEIDKHRARQV